MTRGAIRWMCIVAPVLFIWFLSTAAVGAQTRLIIISGLGGEPQYSQSFRSWSSALADSARTRFNIPPANVTWFGEDSVSKSPLYSGRSTRENIQRAVSAVARTAAAGEQIVIVLIGHGSGEGEDTRISLPGPDITAADFRAMLSQFPTQRVAFVNLTSASGDVMRVLAGPRRIIVTATKSAFERNESQFARHFVAALTVGGADADKDERVSILEAFRYAVAETKRFYETENRLATEHAQLDDNGDGAGSASPDGRAGDGMVARRFFLDMTVTATQAAASDPRLAALYREQDTRRDQIDALRERESEMPAATFEAELEKLLSAFANAAREIRRIEGRP